MVTGNLIRHLIFVTDILFDLIVFNDKRFIDYVKEIQLSEVNVEKANRSSKLPGLVIHRSRSHYPENRHLKQDDIFNRTWWSVLSIDKLVTWQYLSIERTGGHVVLKASSCLRSLMHQRRRRHDLVTAKQFLIYLQKHILCIQSPSYPVFQNFFQLFRYHRTKTI